MRSATSTLITSSSRGGRDGVGRCAQPRVELVDARCGDAEALLRALLGGVVGLDEAVALEPLQRRVHLAGVQRPHLAGAGLELLAELQPVLRTLAEQGQQRVTDAHRSIILSIILSILLDIHDTDKTRSATARRQ